MYIDKKKNKLNFIQNNFFGTIDDVLNCNHKPKKIKDLLINLSNLKSAPQEAPKNLINKEIIMNCIIHIRGCGGWCYHKE